MFNAFYTYRGPLAAVLAGLTLLVAGPAQAGEFRFNAATNAIEMTGTIRSGDGVKFSSLLRAHPETVSVELSASVGGEYTSALEMSLEVKKRGLHTVAEKYCHSGCAYIWLAGATRTVVGAANPEIHLPYANATHQAYPKLTYAWLEALGMSSTFADAVVEGVGPNNNFVKLTPAFLNRFGSSNGQDA